MLLPLAHDSENFVYLGDLRLVFPREVVQLRQGCFVAQLGKEHGKSGCQVCVDLVEGW